MTQSTLPDRSLVTYRNRHGITRRGGKKDFPYGRKFIPLAVAFFSIFASGDDQTAQGQQRNSQAPTNATHFPRVPSEVNRQFDLVRQSVREKRYIDAAVALGNALRHLDHHDYLLVQDDEGLASGYRSQLLSLLPKLDSEVLEQFEHTYGGEARLRLDEAIRTRDVFKLQECAQKWFLTNAGQEASLILARLELNLNRPAAAVRRLTLAPGSAIRPPYDSERSLLLAVALSRSGRSAEAANEIERLRNQTPDAKLLAGDAELSLEDHTRLVQELLPEMVPNPQPPSPPNQWLVHRGDPSRTPVVSPVGSLSTKKWQRDFELSQHHLAIYRSSINEWEGSLPPIGAPIILREQVVARSLKTVQGVQLADGEAVWSFPHGFPQPTELFTTNAEGIQTIPLPRIHAERLWVDASFGRLSSDGTRVFFIDHSQPIEPVARVDAFGVAIFPSQNQPMPVDSNAIIALDVTRQGALSWMIGDVTGIAEPALAGAFFLGPPLHVDGLLYVLAEIKGEVRLLALATNTGRLQWSLTIAQLESETIASCPSRRYPGYSPLYADGILICPTFAGSVVAIDASLRQFLWGFRYLSRPQLQPDPRRLAMNQLERHWYDADIMQAGENVLINGEGNQLFCLDITSGKTRWKRDRRDIMSFAVVGDDQLLLLGEHRFTSVRISDGKPTWPEAPYVAIPGGGSPQGRGLFDGNHFYLPTTDPELLKIRVSDGQVVERKRLDAPLGNLASNGHMLISQSESNLLAFDSRGNEGTKENTSRRAARNYDFKSLSPADVVQLLAEQDFFVRGAASRKLLETKQTSFSALADGARNSNPEIALRCTNLLVHLLDDADRRLAGEARSALVSAAAAKPGNGIAVNAYAREANRRGQNAIRELEKLGAIVKQNGRSVSLPPTWQGKKDGLSHLAWLTQLESLELRHSVVDDSAMAHVCGLPNLKTLNLHRSSITNEALKGLVELPSLDMLLLQGTEVDDGANQYFSRMPQLKVVNLLGTKISAAGVAELQRLRPELNVLH